METPMEIANVSEKKIDLQKFKAIIQDHYYKTALKDLFSTKTFPAQTCCVAYPTNDPEADNFITQLEYKFKSLNMTFITPKNSSSQSNFNNALHEQDQVLLIISNYFLSTKHPIRGEDKNWTYHPLIAQIFTRITQSKKVGIVLLSGAEADEQIKASLLGDLTPLDIRERVYYEQLWEIFKHVREQSQFYPDIIQAEKQLKKKIKKIEDLPESELTQLAEKYGDKLAAELAATREETIADIELFLRQRSEKPNDSPSKFLLVEALKRKYQAEPIAYIKRFYYEKRVPIAESFINLAILKQEEFKEKEKKALSENKEFRDERLQSYETIHQTKELIALPKIFDEERGKKPKHLLIEGRAGIGKSTLCSFIANRWAAGDEERLGAWIHQFKAIIWMPLRQLQNVSNIKTFPEFTHRVCLLKTDQEQISIDQLKQELSILEKQQQLLYLLDGYDEVSDLQNSDLLPLLLEKDYWLLTSRPYCGATRITPDRHLENVGFLDEDITRYVEKFFQDFNESEKAESLLKLIEQNPNIKGIAHVPINLELICSVWKEEYQSAVLKKSPLTLTVLYQEITRLLAKRYLQERCQIDTKYLSPEKYETHSRSKKVLEFFEVLAWQLMQQETLTFKPKIFSALIEKYFPELEEKALNEDIYRHYGLLKGTGEETASHFDQEYYFIHLTFQEYFAARYVVQHLEQEMKFIRAHKYHPRYQIVWWFIAGLLGQSPDKNKLQVYFDLLLDEPKTFREIDQLSLVWRCWDEAGLPTIMQHQWLQECLEDHIANFERYLNLVQEKILKKKPTRKESKLLHDLDKWVKYYLDLSLNLGRQSEIKLKIIRGIARYLTIIREDLYLDRERFNKWLVFIKSEPAIIKILQSDWLKDESKYVRQAAIDSLSELGVKDEVCIQVLLRVLLDVNESGDEDREDKENGIISIKVSEYKERVRAVRHLVKLKIRDEVFIQALMTLVRNENEDSDIRIAAIKGLVDLGVQDKACIQALMTLVKDKNVYEGIRIVAVRGLVELEIKDEAFIQVLIESIKNDPRVQEEALAGLIKLESKEQVCAQLLTLMKYKEGDVGEIAITTLIKLGIKDETCIQGLIILLQNEEYYIQEAAIRVLVSLEVKDEAFIQALLALLQDKREFVQLEVIAALIKLGIHNEVCGQVLLGLLSSENKQMRQAAIWYLVELRINSKACVQALLVLSQDKNEDEYRRVEAINSLVILGVKDEAFIQTLLLLLQDKARWIRKSAMKVLIKLEVKNEEIIQILLTLLKNNEEYIPIAAIEQIEDLIELGIRDEKITQALLLLVKDKREDIRQAATQALVMLKITNEEHIQTLLALLKDKNDSICTDAINALVELKVKDKAVIQYLMKLIHDDSDGDEEHEENREWAINVLIELGVKDKVFIQTLFSFLQRRVSILERGYVIEAAIKGLPKLVAKDATLIQPVFQSLLMLLEHKEQHVQGGAKAVLIRLVLSEQAWFNCLASQNKDVWLTLKKDPSVLPVSLHVLLEIWTKSQNEGVLEFICLKLRDRLVYWHKEHLVYHERGVKEFPVTQEQYVVLHQAYQNECIKPPISKAFIKATLEGNTKGLHELLKQGANINKKDKYSGNTALHLAACVGNEKVVQFLLQAGADYEIKNINGKTAIDYAINYGAFHLATLIVKHSENQKRLHAAEEHRELALSFFRENNLSQAIENWEKIISLGMASPYDHIQIACCYHAQAIMEKRLFLLGEAEFHFTCALELCPHPAARIDYAIFLCQQRRFSETINQLLPIIPQIKQDRWEWYHIADKPRLPKELAQEIDAHYKSLEIRQILLAYYLLIISYQQMNQIGAAQELLPKLQDAIEGPEAIIFPHALDYAVLGYSYKATGNFEEAAACFIQAKRLKYAYSLAQKNWEECQRLAEQIKQQNPFYEQKNTTFSFVEHLADPSDSQAFIIAAQQGDIDIVQNLLARGIDVNMRDNGPTKATALHYAASAGNIEIVQYLLTMGANPMLTDMNGVTAIQWVQPGENTEAIVTLLQELCTEQKPYEVNHKRKMTEETHSTTSSESAFPSTYTTLSKQIGVSKQEDVIEAFLKMDFELQEPQPTHIKKLNEEQAQIQCNKGKLKVAKEKSNTEFILDELADVPSHVEDNEETFSDDEMEEDEETDESMSHPKT